MKDLTRPAQRGAAALAAGATALQAATHLDMAVPQSSVEQHA